MSILPFLYLIEVCTDCATERTSAASEKEEQGLPLQYQGQKAKSRYVRNIQIKTAGTFTTPGKNRKKKHFQDTKKNEETLDWELREMSFQVPSH